MPLSRPSLPGFPLDMESRAVLAPCERNDSDRRTGLQYPDASGASRDCAKCEYQFHYSGEWLPDVADRIVMVQRFEMNLKRFSGDRNALFDNQRCLDGAQCVALNRVGSVGEFDVVIVFQLRKRFGGQRTQCV